jgi:hypothetical protein
MICVDLVTLRRIVLMAVGLIIVSASLTLVFLGMRAVMDVGGSCGSGGPYVIATPCPDGVAGLIPLAIFAGLAGVFLYSMNAWKLPGPRLTFLTWSALFLSLGWNFWEYGLNDGPEWGWIICGIVFVLMGAFPLIGLFNREYFLMTFWADVGSKAPSAGVSLRPGLGGATAPTPVMQAAQANSVADALAQLSALHKQGSLTDDEFSKAKARILEQP